jgi:hypothetical protein
MVSKDEDSITMTRIPDMRLESHLISLLRGPAFLHVCNKATASTEMAMVTRLLPRISTGLYIVDTTTCMHSGYC